MQKATKKRRTEDINFSVSGPQANKEKAVDCLEALGFSIQRDSIPWRDAFPEFRDVPEWSVCLRGAREKESLTQKQLAKLANIPQSHISAMENAKQEIGKERAKRLAKVLDIDYRILL